MLMFGALAVGGSGFAASVMGSTGFVSAGGADCCDSPHPTRSAAAIVVIRRCFIYLRLSNAGAGCGSNYFSFFAKVIKLTIEIANRPNASRTESLPNINPPK